MSNVLMLSAIVMLVLLFFKVPVFIAVLGGSMVYFVMNPGINTVIFAQQDTVPVSYTHLTLPSSDLV